MRYTGYPKLTPNKLERYTTPCAECDAPLRIEEGIVAECVECRTRKFKAEEARLEKLGESGRD